MRYLFSFNVGVYYVFLIRLVVNSSIILGKYLQCLAIITSLCVTGTPGRDQNFAEKSQNFEGHANKLADTAKMVATAGGCRNKKTVEEIFKTSAQVRFTSYRTLREP